MASQYRRVDDSYAVSGLAALANNSWRIGLMASRDQGEDYRFPGGTAVGTSFEEASTVSTQATAPKRATCSSNIAAAKPIHRANPPFALDMVYFNTDFVQGGFRGQIAEDVGLTLRPGHVAVVQTALSV